MFKEKTYLVIGIPNKGTTKQFMSYVTDRWGQDVLFTGVGLNSVDIYKKFGDYTNGCAAITLQGIPDLNLHLAMTKLAFRMVGIEIQQISSVHLSEKKQGRRTIFVIKMIRGIFPTCIAEIASVIKPEIVQTLSSNIAQCLFSEKWKEIFPKEKKDNTLIVGYKDTVPIDDDGNDYYSFLAYCTDPSKCLDELLELSFIPGILQTIAFIKN